MTLPFQPTRWRVLLPCLSLLCAQGLRAAEPVAAKPTLEDFCAGATIEDPELSPDGKQVAYLTFLQNKMALALFHLDTGRAEVLAQPDSDIDSFFWKGNTKLLYRGGRYSTIVRLDLATHQAKQLVGYGTLTNGGYVVDLLPSDPTHIMTWQLRIGRLDVDTGQVLFVEPESPHDAVGAYSVDREGVLRLRCRYSPGLVELQHRRTDKQPFQTVLQWKSAEPNKISLGFGSDPEVAYMITNDDGDLGVLHPFNTRTGVMGPPIATATTAQFAGGEFSRDHTRLLGLQVASDHATHFWIDPHMKKLQDQMDATFPGKVAHVVSFSADESVLIVDVLGGSDPGTFYLLDTRRGAMLPLGRAVPRIKQEFLGRVTRQDIKAADGFVIHAVLTLPPGDAAGVHPMVIMLQTDVFNDRWYVRYHAFSHYLASRGYAVLAVDTRGAWGYGQAYQDAGKREITGRIPADIDDAARWAIASGYAAPGRIGIVGEDFGASLALIEATRHPELYSCVVNRNGEPDLALFAKNVPLYDWRTRQSVEQWIVSDAAAMEKMSAIAAIDQLRAPILNIYDDVDENLAWGRLESALKHAKKHYELYKPLHDDAHKLHDVDYRVDYTRQVVDFLARYLDADPPAVPES